MKISFSAKGRLTKTIIHLILTIINMASYIHKTHKKVVEFDNPENTIAHLQKKGKIPSQIKRISVNNLTEAQNDPLISNKTQKILLKMSDGSFYFGFFNPKGANDNNCIFIFKDGAYFQGGIVNNLIEGKGVLLKQGGDFTQVMYSYDGQWQQGKPHGKGRQMIHNSIQLYDGTFVHGKKEGEGKMIYKDGTIYTGEFKNNQIEGKGTYETKAHKWTGVWKEGYLEGKGEQISFGPQDEPQEDEIAGNSVYKGGFTKGQKNGEGVYTWGNNFAEYSGHFSNGQLDGAGKLKIGQAQYQGEWKKGQQINMESVSRIQLKKKIKKSLVESLKIQSS